MCTDAIISYFKIIGILLVNRRYRNETVVVESLEWCHFFCNVKILSRKAFVREAKINEIGEKLLQVFFL